LKSQGENKMQKELTMLATPQKVKMEELKNLFFQLCSKTCNLKCKHCYIEKNPYKNEEDFIDIEKIKLALNSIKDLKLNSIYLTGGEPLMHPDFNKILRMCLKVTNTTVMSNGVMINDKKVRFLRKIDDESKNETIYRISLDSIDEIENDALRGRGSFRKALSAILSLVKYEFNPIISVVNYKNRKREEIFSEFYDYFCFKGFKMEDINLKVIPYFNKDMLKSVENIERVDESQIKYLDCHSSRTLTQSGVYSCPVLVNDYRARLGSSLDDFSDTTYLDCEKCSVCVNCGSKNQVNDFH